MGWTIAGSRWGGRDRRVLTNGEGERKPPHGVYLSGQTSGALQELGPTRGKLYNFGFLSGKNEIPPVEPHPPPRR